MNDETRRKLRDVIKRLIKATGREPTVEEIAQAANVPVAEVRRAMKITRPPPEIDRPSGE
jgi:RNA polymerase primary sigma factor